MKVTSPFVYAVVISMVIFPLVCAMPRVGGRDNSLSAPALPPSGYIVPLQGSKTCNDSNYCISTLPPPPASKTLKYLAIARGVSTFSCAGRKAVETPLFQAQDTTLWDAAPLLSQIPDEEYFHSLIKELHDFDYTAMKNSSLTCVGSVRSDISQSVFKIADTATFATRTQVMVNAPDKPSIDAPWTYSINNDFNWSVYRVETVGGAPPSTCREKSGKIELDYAAEYWFYS